jgi:KipI family sensor histidine kinase inhibitor
VTIPNTIPHAILPLGDNAVYIEFSQKLDLEVNEAVQQLAAGVRSQSVPWLRDIVPTLGGLALHFDSDHLGLPESPIDACRQLIDVCLALPSIPDQASELVIEFPVCYEPEFAPDLDDVARQLGLSGDEVVRRHSSAQYRVLMMGFVPGHPYLGGLDPVLIVPRRATPRAKVAAGSVAIANAQSSIYPFEIPGGWNLIGRTPMILFDSARTSPCLLAPRNRVRFVPISGQEFMRLQREFKP